MRVIHTKVIHVSYLHSLNGIGVYNLGGEIMLDQMLHLGASKFLDTHLNTVPTKRAQAAVDFAATIVEKETTAIVEMFRCHPLLPADYLQDTDVATVFSIDRIAAFVQYICNAEKN